MSMYSDIHDSGATGWLVGAVKNNPEGLLLLAAGCALLMRSTGTSKSRTRVGRWVLWDCCGTLLGSLWDQQVLEPRRCRAERIMDDPAIPGA